MAMLSVLCGELYAADGDMLVSGKLGVGTTSPESEFQLGNYTTNSNAYIIFGKRVASAQTNLPFIGHDSIDGVSSDLGLGAISTSGGINFYTGNAGRFYLENIRMRITGTGNVGIGTTGPLSKLEVDGSACTLTPQDIITLARPYNSGLSYARTAALTLSNDTSDRTVLSFKLLAANGVAVVAPDTTIMTLRSDGNIGIGTTIPGAKLHVSSGDILLDNQYALYSKNSSGSNLPVLAINSSNMTTLFSGGWGYEFLNIAQNASLLTILDGGTVGIGTTGTPNAKLQVNGSVSFGKDTSPLANANKALCWTDIGKIGYCSSAISSSGVCTCNPIN